MSDLEVILIILLVVGIVASNLAVLRYSAKFKMPQFGEPKDKSTPSTKNKSTPDKSQLNNGKSLSTKNIDKK